MQVLDPLDGTPGFLKGYDVLYVVCYLSKLLHCTYVIFMKTTRQGVKNFSLIFGFLFYLPTVEKFQVGLALVVEGEIVLGVMGCPNWQRDLSDESYSEDLERGGVWSRSGAIMIARAGCGTGTRRLLDMQSPHRLFHNWTRCFVNEYCLVHEARFCIPDSQTWESLPLSTSLQATTNADQVGNGQILLLRTCCGRYLLQLRIINSIDANANDL